MFKRDNKKKQGFFKGMALSVSMLFSLQSLVNAEILQQDMTDAQKLEQANLMARNGDYDNAVLIFENELLVKNSDVSEEIVRDYMAVLGWAARYQELLGVYESRYAEKQNVLPAFLQELVADAYYSTGQYTKANELYALAVGGSVAAAETGAQGTSYQTVGASANRRETAVLLGRAGDYTGAISIFENELSANASDAPEEIVQDYIAVLSWAGKYQDVIDVFQDRYDGKGELLPAFLQRLVADAYYGLEYYEKAGELYKTAAEGGDEPAVIGLRKTRFLLKETAANGMRTQYFDTSDALEVSNVADAEKQEVAVLLARKGFYEQALLIFERDLQANAPDTTATVIDDYMAVLNWAGRDADVVKIYEEKYSAEPDKLSPFLQNLVADSYYKLGRFVEAKNLYQSAAAEDRASIAGVQKAELRLGTIQPDGEGASVQAIREYAVEQARINQFAQAITLINGLIHRAVADDQCYYDLIAIYNWAGQNDKAFAVYEEKFAAAPEGLPANTLRTMGNVCLDLGDYTKAKEFYNMAAKAGDKTAVTLAADVDARQGDISSAMNVFDELVANNPYDPDSYVQRANAYVRAGAYYSAKSDYEKALSLVPENDFEKRRQVQSTRAALYIGAGEFAEGRDILEPYIKNETATPVMQADYIVSLQGTGDYAQAIETGERIWSDKSVAPAYGLRALGDCYLRTRKYSDALKCHAVIIEQDVPERATAMLSYAYALAASNKIDAAKKAYADIIDQFPQYKGIIAGDAKGLFERRRFHAGKAVFQTLADSDPAYGPYRQQLAFDLFINAMPREAYVEYKRLAEETPSKEAGYAGMVQSAIMYGDYHAAECALKELAKYDTGSKEASEAQKAWDDRWRGSFDVGYTLYGDYKNRKYGYPGMNLETDVGSSWRLLANAGYNSFKEDDEKQNVFYGSLGLGYIARKFDIRAWGSIFADTLDKSGYSIASNYYFNDFTWLGYNQTRGGIDNPLGLAQSIMQTSYDLSFNRRVGAKDLYTAGYVWNSYTDDNRSKGYYWRFGHMALDTAAKEIEWYLYGNHYGWTNETPLYDSPTSRVGYGPGLRMRWNKPRVGYWEWITELGMGHDRPDATDFTPYMRLERGWELGPRSLLVTGAEFGVRTDRTDDDVSGMHFSHRQFDIRYYLTW